MRQILFRFLVPMLLAAPAAPAQELLLFDAATFDDIVLSQTEALTGGVQLEAGIGAYNNEFIANYGANSIFARTGRAVGQLRVLTDKGHFPCTAFLVAGNRLVTNHHCVPGILDNRDIGASAIVAVKFLAGYVIDGVEEGVQTFHVNPVPLESNEDLDYSVLQVIGDANAAFGALELAAATPEDGDPFWVIGHPMGEAQRISREKCQAATPALAGVKLRHTCDTLPGNSGSPVIDAGLQKVVALHHAGSRVSAVNFAISMAEILAASAVLEASVEPAPDTAEVEAAVAFGKAMDIENLADRMAALRAVSAAFPGTTGAALAEARFDAPMSFRHAAYLEVDSEGGWQVRFSPDGRFLVASSIGAVHVWRTSDGARVSRLDLGDEDNIAFFKVFPASPLVLAWTFDTAPSVWDMSTGEKLVTLKDGEKTSTYGGDISADGRRVVSCSGPSGDIVVWETATWQPVARMAGHRDVVAECVFSPDSRYLLSGSFDGTLRYWDAQTGKELWRGLEPGGTVDLVAFSDDGSTAVSLDWLEEGGIRLWETASGRQLRTLRIFSSDDPTRWFVTNGPRIVTQAKKGVIQVWDAGTGREISRFESEVAEESGEWISDLSPDGRLLLTTLPDGSLVRSAETGEILARLGERPGMRSNAVFSGDGRMIATRIADGAVGLWKADP